MDCFGNDPVGVLGNKDLSRLGNALHTGGNVNLITNLRVFPFG